MLHSKPIIINLVQLSIRPSKSNKLWIMIKESKS
jgi:hypothetical protein